MAVYEFPTSFGQRRMWLLAQLDPDQPTYNIAWALWLDGELDEAALRGAWNAALSRHEALRTSFRDESGLPVQVIEDEPAEQELPVLSVSELAEQEREPAARRLIGQLAGTPIDPVAGTPMLVRLVRLAPDRHVLAVVLHHIVADGWSFRILFEELAADYAAIRDGGGPVTEEPAIQYADYALWQLEQAEAGNTGPSERFWRAELAGTAGALPLPVEAGYPARQTFAADGIDSRIEPELADRLRRLAAESGTTLFAVLMAAYAVVLARLSGEDDLVVAVPMAARTQPETESVVGLFMNTVPVRVRLTPGATLAELIRSVHEATARVLAQQELPFARVVELARPERDPARLPLAQVMFAMEESWAVPDRGGLHWRPELIENGTAKFEVELTVTDAAGGPRVRVSYNSTLFSADTGRLVADGFARVLGELADEPHLPVAEAELMSPDTYRLVTQDWPDGGPAPDPEATAVARLWNACAGDTPLVKGSDGTLTGNQLREQAAVLARALRQQGIGADDRVAILLARGARILPTVLGIWSVGACYLPLDPIYPELRLAGMLADAGARAVVIDSAAPDAPRPPAGSAVAVLDLAVLTGTDLPEASDDDTAGDEAPGDGASDDGAAENAAGPVAVPPSAAAYTIFTSGSTGRPKAVTVSQGNLATLLDAVAPLLALTPADRLVATSTFTFDIATVELFAPVLAGARLVVADSEQVRDASMLRQLLTDTGATALQATPAGWRMLLDAGGVPAGVRLRLTAGEALDRDLADALTGPDVRLWNLYGPTETTVYSGGALVEPSPSPIEIGSILPGSRLYVLDGNGRPVPPGVLGEVYVGGVGVSQGYAGAPGLTAGRFRPDPFTSGRPGDRLYRTGDVGRWRASGQIELAGRADRQIKIRGYRIESGEVEAALRTEPEVAEAVVSVRGSGPDVRLIGYLVSRSGADQPPAGLRERLRDVLPDYMVPSAFVLLPRLPLTASGKIDHRALPEPDWAAAAGQQPTAPRTPLESGLAALFAELLALPHPVGVTDNFFALGGHSLTATQLMIRVRTEYGVELPLRALFLDPTVAGLAAAVTGERS